MYIQLLKKINWRKTHGRLGLLSCIGILTWAGSGITHPIMSRLQTMPVTFSAPNQTLDLSESASPDKVLKNAGISDFTQLSVVKFNYVDYFRVVEKVNTPARYFEATKANPAIELANGDAEYAKFLASHYTGKPISDVIKADFVTEFSTDYHAINQLLPVWRVEFVGEKNLRAFIDTDQARLSTLVDNLRYTLTQVFQFGHNWAFLSGASPIQITLMGLLLSAILISAISGVYLFFKQRRLASSRLKNQTTLKFHRVIGLSVALSALLFVSSGFYHLIKSNEQAHRISPKRELVAFKTADLSADIWANLTQSPLQKINLVSNQSQPSWLLQTAQLQTQVGHLAQLDRQKESSKKDSPAESHQHHDHAAHRVSTEMLVPASLSPSSVMSDVMEYSRALAKEYAKLPTEKIVSVELLTAFGGEYGFFFKRLPVVKVQFQSLEHPRYYVEPATGALAAKVMDSDATEGWIFAYLHKWNFIPLGHDGRDLVVALFALLNILVALLGLTMFINKLR
jgi:hypothetical protein